MKGRIGHLILLLIVYSSCYNAQNCIPRSFGLNSVVCVCNATHCDDIHPPSELRTGEYISYTSTQSGQRFKVDSGFFQNPTTKSTEDDTIYLNSNISYQSIHGWGGAFTDSAGINIKLLPESVQEKLLKSYFGSTSINYNLCRVPIGGTDFSTHGYSYNDGPEDPELVNFKLAQEDYDYKIPYMKWAKTLNKNLEFFASAWTAPKWMKYNGKYTGPDFLKKGMYQSWTNYFIKFLRAYKNENLEFWGITTGNQPSTGLVPVSVNSVGWTASQMSNFISDNLGPSLRKSEFASIKLIAIDDKLFQFPIVIDKIFEARDTARSYVDGFGVHWYWNHHFPYSYLTTTHNRYPDKFIISTEACEGSFSNNHKGVRLGDWNRGQSYALDIIKDMQNWVTGWIDWNMALDPSGGPTYINNNVDSPIIVNGTAQEFYKQPMYYALGHFSKFIPKNSVRVDVEQASNKLDIVGFVTPSGVNVVVILNRKAKRRTLKIKNGEGKAIIKDIPGKSITTVLYH